MSDIGPSKASNTRFADQTKHPNIIDGNLMDGEGSIGTRAQKLMKLQRLGVVEKNFDFPKLVQGDPNVFNFVENSALTAARQKATTQGFMLRHVKGSDPRMQEVWFEGDPAVCWDMFKAPAFYGKINKDVGTHEETVKLRDSDELVILRSDGSIVRQNGAVIRHADSGSRNDASDFQRDITEAKNAPVGYGT
ncbi:hypothetical protein [Dyella sp. 2HG41-7]|uniref:hypothetical protein n=1 Tax=Dyella sp. 2HG41-7 TaxID=2883239 RepID=UPI001F271810|nr:hypothetical protein [Dyella sp. 2HG41-7]